MEDRKEEFVQRIQKHDTIWKFSSPDYAHLVKKRKAWDEILSHFHEGYATMTRRRKDEKLREAKRLWKNLRDAQRRFVKSGGDVDKYKRKYKLGEMLSFVNAETRIKPYTALPEPPPLRPLTPTPSSYSPQLPEPQPPSSTPSPPQSPAQQPQTLLQQQHETLININNTLIHLSEQLKNINTYISPPACPISAAVHKVVSAPDFVQNFLNFISPPPPSLMNIFFTSCLPIVERIPADYYPAIQKQILEILLSFQIKLEKHSPPSSPNKY